MRVRLDKYEKEIEKDAEAYRAVTGKERQEVENTLDRIRKTRNVNIRISEAVLDKLKQRSLEEGIPYQTLISSILHKYVTNRLVDEAAIRKSVELLHSSR